ncbi:HAD-IC family P-type ATPase [Olsenella urininfantis]|uniref:HAD-IC family P-type ATPase n=1 Tax=Olsenella urininfantis TaxID=1871033 RepID=UPI000986376F|nr:HAD-IC family P-type ATPase [Olsenella urininfantis]
MTTVAPDEEAACESWTVAGLSSDEALRLAQEGKANTGTAVRTRTVGQIVLENLVTPFNGINLAMALLVAHTGAWRNMLFVGVVAANLGIGIFQELRAKRMVDRLTILTSKPARVLRDAREAEVPIDQIVLGDVILLSHGDQVPADSTVISGEASVDESLLTGESRNVSKRAGDQVVGGSHVVSGSLRARARVVGAEGYAARLAGEAGRVRPVRSEIQDAIDLIVRSATRVLVPLGCILFARMYLLGHISLNGSILSAIAAVIGMIPQGLVLLTSSVMAIAATRLARRGVLAQRSRCIETLARVDTLCLDKTGTLTTGHMELVRVVGEGGVDEGLSRRAISALASSNADDVNATSAAILSWSQREGISHEAVTRSVPFDSSRKMSGCTLETGESFVMGAAPFVLGEGGARGLADIREDALERVLVVCSCDGFDGRGLPLGEPRPLCQLALRDELRASAPSTMGYFAEQGVELIVISGDDPATAAAIASRAGVPHANRAVDATGMSDEELMSHASSARVFGRVTPEQKRSLVRALHALGRTVAMTGDGVNDILALRESDCAVSFASGTDAARNVADVVLADDDFSHMPEVVAEGRRSINNLQRSASLFLVKTVFSAVVAAFCVLLPPYPFIPVQMSLVSTAVIGIPSFVLALEPNSQRVSGNFLENVLRRSLPASAVISLGLLAALVARELVGMSAEEASVMCMAIVSVVGFALIRRISLPLNALRAGVLFVVAATVIVGCLAFPDFYRLSAPSPAMLILLAFLSLASWCLFDRLFARSCADGRYARALIDALNRLHGR